MAANLPNYIESLSEEERLIFLKILANLAKADGKFEDEERAFLEETAVIMNISSDKLQELYADVNNEELLTLASKIKNRKAALHLIKEACFLANSDGDFSDSEVVLIGKIGQSMGIELEKIEQISLWVIDFIEWREKGKIIFE